MGECPVSITLEVSTHTSPRGAPMENDTPILTLMSLGMERIEVDGEGTLLYFRGTSGTPDFRVALWSADAQTTLAELRRVLDRLQAIPAIPSNDLH